MNASPPRFFSSPYLRIGLGLSLSGLTLYLALRDLDFREVWRVITQADFLFLTLAFISVIATILLKVHRWRVLLGLQGYAVVFFDLFKSLSFGQLLNIVFPARIGELSRAQVIGNRGPGQAFVLGTIVVEKILDIVAYALLFLGLLLTLPLPGWISKSGYWFVGCAVLVTVGLLFVTQRRSWVEQAVGRGLGRLPEKYKSFFTRHLHGGLSSLIVLKGNVEVVFLSLETTLIWILAISTNYLVLEALGMQLPWTASILILVVLQASISLPSVPARIGIFEYACVLSLAVFQIEQAQALSFGILLHGIVFIPLIALGLISYWLLG